MRNPIRACLCILAYVFFLVGCAPGPGTKAPEAAVTDDQVKDDLMVLELVAGPDADKEELENSLSRLYDRGCTGIDSVTQLKEDGAWTYLMITGPDRQTFYADMNKHGMFGSVLSQKGMDDADLIAETIGINVNRNILYAAEQMELCGCGHIRSVKGSECKKSSYVITIINGQNNEFTITLGDDGELGMIRDQDGQPVYEPFE